jgi:hypothetical protein
MRKRKNKHLKNRGRAPHEHTIVKPRNTTQQWERKRQRKRGEMRRRRRGAVLL